MALPLTDRDKFLLLAALGLPESANRVIALLDLAGTGNMTGPGVATDNAVVRFDGTTGALVQNSPVIISDAGALSGVTGFSTNSISLAAGSAGAPSLNFGSATTGLYAPAANQIGISVNSNELMQFSNALIQTINTPLYFSRPDATADWEALRLVSGTAIGTVRQYFRNSTSTRLFEFDAAFSAGTENLLLQSDSNAIAQFNRNGSTQLFGTLSLPSGSAALPSYSFTGDPDSGMYRSSANDVRLSAGGSDRLSAQSGGVEVLNGQLFITDGSAASPSLTFSADQNTGLTRLGADNIAITAGGAARFQVNGSVIQIGESGDTSTIHQINSGLQAPAAGVLTLTNGPGASTGNPAVYLKLNINGTNYVIPAWAF